MGDRDDRDRRTSWRVADNTGTSVALFAGAAVALVLLVTMAVGPLGRQRDEAPALSA